jgi:hypothetical protein
MREKVFCVSTGYENIVANRIKEINDIIKKNSNASIQQVVDKIANVSMWSWSVCYSKGAIRGRISNVTVASLKNFFGIPEEVFAGKGEFSNEHREIIASKIKEVFGNVPKAKRGQKVKKVIAIKEKVVKKVAKAKKVKVVKTKKAKPENKKIIEVAKPKRKAGRPKKIKETVDKANEKTLSSIEARLREFAHEINGIKELKQMNGLSETLAKLSNIANKKMELLTAFQSL